MHRSLKIFQALAALLLGFSLVQAADTSGPSPDDLSPIYVEIVDMLIQRSHDSWTSPSMEKDRFAAMKLSIEEAFAKIDLPRETKVVRFNSRIPKDSPHIQILITQWELDSMMPSTGDYVCRISAKSFLPNGEKIDFGSVLGKAAIFQSVSRGTGRNYRDYKQSSDDAMRKMMPLIIKQLSPDSRVTPPPEATE